MSAGRVASENKPQQPRIWRPLPGICPDPTPHAILPGYPSTPNGQNASESKTREKVGLDRQPRALLAGLRFFACRGISEPRSRAKNRRFPLDEDSLLRRRRRAAGPQPIAMTKYLAGIFPTFIRPCSSLEAMKATDPDSLMTAVFPSIIISTVPSRRIKSSSRT